MEKELIAEFAAIARENGAALILDETHREFSSRDARPHDLFTDHDWLVTLMQV